MPESFAQMVQGAKEAYRAKDFGRAEALWRACLANAPRSTDALVGLITTLLSAEKIDEAEETARRLSWRAARDTQGIILFAKIAEARGDAAGAIKHWRNVLARQGDHFQALGRLATLLLNKGQLPEAQSLTDQMQALRPDIPAGLILSARIAEAGGNSTLAISRWQIAAEKFPDQRLIQRELGRLLVDAGEFARSEAVIAALQKLDPKESIRLRGRILSQTEPNADFTKFWHEAAQAHADNMDFARKWLHSALREQRQAEAITAMDNLLATHPVRANEANFVIGVCNIQFARDDREPACRLLRAYLRPMMGTDDYDVAVLKLSRIILTLAPQSSEMIDARYRERLGRLGAGDSVKSLLARILNVQRIIGQLSSRNFTDTDISAQACRALVDVVRDRLLANAPFSLIRLGDGEASALAYEEDLAHFAAADAGEREIVWWGRPITATQRTELSARVAATFTTADAVGIPTIARFLRDIRISEDDDLRGTRVGRGLRTVLRWLEEREQSNAGAAIVTSAHVHQDLQRWNLYPALLNGVADIVTVSSHAGLPERMRQLFGVTVRQNILVPPRHADLPSGAVAPTVLPDVLDNLLEALGDVGPGTLVLVGAGYAGKLFVDEAKKRGGVALDIGSILDEWMGIRTRSYVDLA